MFLNAKLDTIEDEKLISFHMPGHKNGRLLERHMHMRLSRDITEIPGADNLHAPEEAIASLEGEIASFYGSEQAKILINGSTVGILSMILGSLNRGDKILINRNAHQSVYHAIVLGGLKVEYYYPKTFKSIAMVETFHLASLESLLASHPDIRACVLTYPTYEGICYPIEPLIRRLHEKGILVLVDAAHGAHLALDDSELCPLNLGADVVIQSLHKTLPAMTQTAILHFGKNNALSLEQKNRILWHLKALQTSSPSYILMSSVDAMMDVIKSFGPQRTKAVKRYTRNFFKRVNGLKKMTCHPFQNQEFSKLIVSIKEEALSESCNGFILSKLLRENYGIQAEYALEEYVLLMSSMCSEEEDFKALSTALTEIDSLWETRDDVKRLKLKGFESYYEPKEPALSMEGAMQSENDILSYEAALGRICAEFVIPYPPGIPLLVPGEVITESVMPYLSQYKTTIKVTRCMNG